MPQEKAQAGESGLQKEEYALLGDARTREGGLPETEASVLRIDNLERYSYFQGKHITASAKVHKKVLAAGCKLIEDKELALKSVRAGFDRTGGEVLGEADAVGRSGREEFPVQIVFSRDSIKVKDCKCPKCRRKYYSWYSDKTDCPFLAGTILLAERYLETHNIGDSTDRQGKGLLSFYQNKRAGRMAESASQGESKLTLVPRLSRKDNTLSVSFKIGEKRLFVIKKLDVFCENVRHGATGTYGANTQIHHDRERFSEEGRGWIRFIMRIVTDEAEFSQRLARSRGPYGHRNSGVGSELRLYGWRLDAFFAQLAGESVEFDDKDDWRKRKRNLSGRQKNPEMTMRIDPERLESGGDFHGIRVKGSLPDLYYGADTAYYISERHLNRLDSDFLEKIEPLASMAEGDAFSFCIGRNRLSDFYHRALPQLADVADIVETEPEEIRKYLLPEARYVFYLDAAEKNVFCRARAAYGDREVSVLDALRDREDAAEAGHVRKELEPFRDAAGEREILENVRKMLPEIDWERDELHCGGDEDLVFRMTERGTEALMQLGEVRCTKSFLGMRIVKSVKASVGVSVSSGLLELDISTGDVPHDELLDILSSYRAKKKYYRMKDGSFVHLNDSSLDMLSELMQAAHIRPKDFAKGKIRLPMYRALYLDKMLEENESAYSGRDSYFRNIAEGFRTAQDADFKEPERLSKVMRGYQKNGYRWLRMLETWQFGGILADDMGLGKTLQVIAVLLAAKQEGKEGTSLVVAPASLVYNWAEELERFAPELSVSLITGTQEERREKIGAWRESDVLVTSYDLLKRDILLYEETEFRYEVIDEAQYIKNHATAAAKAVKVVKSRTRYALTGTPIENRLSELWSIFDYLMPGFLYGYDVFKREMEVPVVKNGDDAAMRRLQKMAGPFILRRLKEDVLKDLPDKLEECRYVRLEGVQRKLYDGQALKIMESIQGQKEEEFNQNKMQALAQLMRLRQICCDPSLCFEDYHGGAAKLLACMQLIQSAADGGHRMLVFSQFASMLKILAGKLEAEGISYYVITGADSKEKRQQMVKEFNEGDAPVFLISLKAGGVGLNLTGADVVIHYDPWWNVAVQNQATGRAHRIGQTKKVTVYKLIAKNTIEEKIQKLQDAKRDLAEQVIRGSFAQLGGLSKEELLELLEV